MPTSDRRYPSHHPDHPAAAPDCLSTAGCFWSPCCGLSVGRKQPGRSSGYKPAPALAALRPVLTSWPSRTKHSGPGQVILGCAGLAGQRDPAADRARIANQVAAEHLGRPGVGASREMRLRTVFHDAVVGRGRCGRCRRSGGASAGRTSRSAPSGPSGRRFSAFHERLLWPARELRMILKNRSPAISITDEDIRELTGRFEVVYAVGDDPDAILPPPDAVAGA
jgi:hypothetical protein